MQGAFTSDELNELMYSFEGEQVPLTIHALNDGIEFSIELRHHPPTILRVAPNELWVNDTLVVNEVNRDMFDDALFIAEGDNRNFIAEVEDVEYIPSGVGPEQYRVRVSTVSGAADLFAEQR